MDSPIQKSSTKALKGQKTKKRLKTEPVVITSKADLFSNDCFGVESPEMQVQGLHITIGEVSTVNTEMIMSVDEPLESKEDESFEMNESKRKHYTQKFRKAWLEIPEFQDWLVEGIEPNTSMCKICKKTLVAGKSELVRHCRGRKHKIKMAEHGMTQSIRQSRGSEDLPDEFASETGLPESVTYIDLRSDTVTRPDRIMKKVMFEASIGDDAFHEDQMVNNLEQKVADLLEKEAALYVPSGTMANLICVLTHCWGRGSEIVVGDESYIYKKTQGGMAQIGGVHHRIIQNTPDGTFSLDDLRGLIQENDTVCPMTTLVCVENTHNRMGGKALPLKWLDQLGALCEELNLQLHMDGARLMNAAVALGVAPSKLVAKCDSVTFCMNKGLGAPMGSLVVGTTEFITRASKIRKMLGGSLHQCGMMAAAGIYAIDHIAPKLSADHNNARAIGHSVMEEHSSAVTVDMKSFQTNIGFLHCDNIRVDAHKLCQRLKLVTDTEAEVLGAKIILMMLPITDTIVRFMTHYEIKREHVKAIAKKLKYIIQEYDNIMYVEYKVAM